MRKFVDAALQAFGRIDVLVNNAGTHLRGTVESTTSAILEQQLARQAVRLRDDPGGAPHHEASARRTDREYRRTGGTTSPSRPVSVRRHQRRRDGDDEIGGRRGGARQHPRQRGLPAIHRIRAARVADRQGNARARASIGRPRQPVLALQSAGTHRDAGGGRGSRRLSGVRLLRFHRPEARSSIDGGYHRYVFG